MAIRNENFINFPKKFDYFLQKNRLMNLDKIKNGSEKKIVAPIKGKDREDEN
jgi:hypothetical protein